MNVNEETLLSPVAKFLEQADELIAVYETELNDDVSPSLSTYREPILRVCRVLEDLLKDEEYTQLEEFFEGQFNSIDPTLFGDESLETVKKYSEFGR